MRLSQLLAPTLRETPAEAEIASHKLMLRAGLMRKSAAGMYTFLPLGLRVIQKLEAIIREEMNAAGSQELLLPILQPAELWEETGRWHDYGDEMFRLKDRHGRMFCLGPTHEEIITALVRGEVSSYRQLPLILYQIQDKFRDEIRPRFGVIRGREFIMKDAYSFDRDEAGLELSYQKMYRAYERIFARMGLKTRAVQADPGAIGGSTTHEFMVLADAGEAEIVHCTACSYAANVEKAEAVPVPVTIGKVPAAQPVPVATPDVRTIEALEGFLQVPSSAMIKTLLYTPPSGGKPVAALIRGDRVLGDLKLSRALGGLPLEMASPAEVEQITGGPVGFSGPVGLQGVTLVADPEVMAMTWAVTGANRADEHLMGVVPGRDFTPDLVIDIRTAVAGDPCPACAAPLHAAKGIEVGQVFKLGTKYSEALGARFLSEDGREQPIIMGCYGIGVTRSLAAIIEQHHDENGIIWPVAVAPYHVVVVPVNVKDERLRQAAEQIYEALCEAGIEAILDDRDERPGVKFKDADLLGFPFRVTVGPRSLGEGKCELRTRATGADELLDIDAVAASLADRIDKALRATSEG